ncbi:MAG TPA: UDP-N-acetylmuramate:L-alanyl-gamma-D-glutamyl-meso-diaminopimelate ligase [Vicinamibacterales bacterium]|nr:UDP-N-acetylmuramate:L-alanyl-gamma-D-glutamyl-meso-diaminopimelate ligase [Vicinamibacterales bacterium]
MTKRIHFIGICGTGMATLAAMLKARGFDVQGSDVGVYPPMSEFLEKEQIRAFDGYAPEHISGVLDSVIVGNAISRGNAELEEVLDRKIRFQSMPEAIREHFLWSARSIVIAGTHGKTTTTALAGWLLAACGQDPTVLIGGISTNFGSSYRMGSGRDFVIEGDEYDSAFFDKTAKFLKYLPDIVVIGNLEYDHADIYPDMDALRLAFRRLVGLVPRSGRLILGADSLEARDLAALARCPVETFGLAPDADWRASEIRPDGHRMTFELTARGEQLGHVTMPLIGSHNVQNALAALAVGRATGLSAEEMIRALKGFQGVRRRLELRGTERGVSVFDDFAHHPTAIRETLKAVRWSYPDRRIWAIFEPRSATSCRRIFQDDFARAFADTEADEIILAAVFRSTLPEQERLSIDQLVHDLQRAGKHVRHVPKVDDIVALVAREARDGDLVVIMSNGGFDGIHDKLLAALKTSGVVS